MPQLDIDGLERALCQLPTVYSAKVLPDRDNEALDKVHVLALPGRAPKRIVRDIETLLLLKFNLRLDYRKISLVQIQPEAIQPFMRPRLRLNSVRQLTEGRERVVEVSLEGDGRSYSGTALMSSDRSPGESAARATLRALAALYPDFIFQLNVTETVVINEEAAVVVSVTVEGDQNRASFLGCSFTRDCELSAAARATLDAVNRRLFL